MPCYEAPPEWVGDAKKNAEEAVRILCAQIGKAVEAGIIPKRHLMEWLVEHRKIDLRMAIDSYFPKSEVEREAIRRDIARLEAILSRTAA
jgi:hypothetical protein